MSGRIVALEALGADADEAAGGKAAGLARLIRLGLPVPGGFVVIDAEPGALPVDLGEQYAALGGGPVAVRSSALGEDGVETSFAGQYETILDVSGEQQLGEAVERCLGSLQGQRVEAYRERLDGEPTRMAVVVQRMVAARTAGVLFTVDPVTGRRDRVVIDAVAGLGESLVSGERTPDHYECDRTGRVRLSEIQGEQPELSSAELDLLLGGALAAEQAAGEPLDLEWAIDSDGALYWLQARPVTVLPADPKELDTRARPGDLYTRSNVGEMMPGAVTPLTFSVTGRGVEVGMQRMFVACGALEAETPAWIFVGMTQQNLFLNLTSMARMGTYVLGASAEQVALSICGRPVPELTIAPPVALPIRLYNAVRYFRLLLRARSHIAALDQLCQSIEFPESKNSADLYAAIDGEQDRLHDAYCHHLLSSAGSGAVAGILAGVLAQGNVPSEANFAQVAQILAGADGVESADVVAGVDRLVDRLAAHPEASAFLDFGPDEALAWLKSPAAGEVRLEFERYLRRHGHRAVRELELRQVEWREDPRALIASLPGALRARLAAHIPVPKTSTQQRALPPPFDRGLLARLVPVAHAAVRNREQSKSLLVELGVRFKRAYRELGDLLTGENVLSDPDLVFFFTHQELGDLVAADESVASRMVAKARLRREALPRMMALDFPELWAGLPEPELLVPTATDDVLVGKPVSRGRVSGPARVVRTLAEAHTIEPGDILIAPITDVGWTPYFASIAGLATDLGSAVSHGAVVAREYGLPAVVNLRVATRSFESGEQVELDADLGTLKRL